MIRQGRPFAPLLGIDRPREIEILRRIQHLDIGPELLSADLRRDRTIFRAIPGVSLDCCEIQTTILAQSLTVLSRLHSQRGTEAPFAASNLIRHYLALTPLSAAFQDFCEHQASLSEQLERSAKPGLCHNDCVAKNWILTPDGGLRLIDFEFAAPNDRAFDLATWCLEFGVTPCNPFMTNYHGWEPALEQRIRAYLPVVDTLWILYCQSVGQKTSGSVRRAVIAQLRRRVNRLALTCPTFPTIFGKQ